MKTGMTRAIDDLGRISIPKEIRRNLGIVNGDYLEIAVKENKIILEKAVPGCVFCGDPSATEKFFDKPICEACKIGLRRALSK